MAVVIIIALHWDACRGTADVAPFIARLIKQYKFKLSD